MSLRPIVKPVRMISTAPSGYEGEGFPVRRAFAGIQLEHLDPFIHMDQMGAINYGPYEARGTDWHPHRGFETVTYMLEGTFLHQDSHGGGGTIQPGDTQWMTAGSGILHIETPPEDLVVSGGLFHGVQLWVNLPSRLKMVEPRYQNLEAEHVRVFAVDDEAVTVRMIAGEINATKGPGSTYTPMTFAHATLSPGSRLQVSWPKNHNSLIYILEGVGYVSEEKVPAKEGQLVVLGEGDDIVMYGDDRCLTEILLLGGQPIRESVAAYGPFVMNTREELRQAFDDYQSGKLGVIPEDGIRPYRPR